MAIFCSPNFCLLSWRFFADSTIVNHHVSPPFGGICVIVRKQNCKSKANKTPTITRCHFDTKKSLEDFFSWVTGGKS